MLWKPTPRSLFVCELSQRCSDITEIWDKLPEIVHHAKESLHGWDILRDWHVCDRHCFGGVGLEALLCEYVTHITDLVQVEPALERV